MYQRSRLFQKSKPKVLMSPSQCTRLFEGNNVFILLIFPFFLQSKALEVKMSSDLSQFSIGEELFGIGDMVVVFSVISQESFSGVITAISHR